MTSDLRLYLFGMPRLEYQQSPVPIDRRKALALAAYLGVFETRQSREVIVSLLWSDLDQEHGRSALRSTLHSLTAPVPFEWIQSDRDSITLNREHVWIDTDEFRRLLVASRSHGHPIDTLCDQCVELYERAAALYQGEFLAGFSLADSLEFDEWQRTQRDWLHREYAALHKRLSDTYAQAEQIDRAIAHAQAWLAADGFHEPAHRLLMSLYAANGQRADALRQYKQCADVLDREFASTPTGETIQLYEAIQADRLPARPYSASTSGALSSILPSLPPLVVGREESLSEIKQRLIPPEKRPVTVIQGWPGVGKSTITALLAHDADIAGLFPDGVLWVSLGESPDVASEISTWADALKLGEPGRVRKIEDISAQITAALRDRRVLLIVDDVWQPDHALPFVVGGQQCALIMTSRLNDVALALAPTPGDIYRLPVLREDAALDLLARLVPDIVTTYPAEVRELVRDLEGLPLAIHVAGRLLHSEAHMGWSIRELLVELRIGTTLLEAQAPSTMLGIRGDTSPTVAALLKRSTDSLDEEMRRRFAFLGLFVPKPATFHLDAMAVAWDVPDAKPTARVLVNRGLLEPVSGGRFQMHSLLVWHARSLLKEEGFQL